MTYLITGATGGLGQSILDVLSKKVPASEIAVLVAFFKTGISGVAEWIFTSVNNCFFHLIH